MFVETCFMYNNTLVFFIFNRQAIQAYCGGIRSSTKRAFLRGTPPFILLSLDVFARQGILTDVTHLPKGMEFVTGERCVPDISIYIYIHSKRTCINTVVILCIDVPSCTDEALNTETCISVDCTIYIYIYILLHDKFPIDQASFKIPITFHIKTQLILILYFGKTAIVYLV